MQYVLCTKDVLIILSTTTAFFTKIVSNTCAVGIQHKKPYAELVNSYC